MGVNKGLPVLSTFLFQVANMAIYAIYTKIYSVSFVKIGTRKATEYEPVNLFSAALTSCNVPNIATQWSTSHSKGSGFKLHRTISYTE